MTTRSLGPWSTRHCAGTFPLSTLSRSCSRWRWTSPLVTMRPTPISTTYVYGSAAVIGLQMVPILEPLDNDAYVHACELGVAFQLANFIRDVGEDLDRGRVYLPLDELAMFDLQRSDLERQGRGRPSAGPPRLPDRASPTTGGLIAARHRDACIRQAARVSMLPACSTAASSTRLSASTTRCSTNARRYRCGDAFRWPRQRGCPRSERGVSRASAAGLPSARVECLASPTTPTDRASTRRCRIRRARLRQVQTRADRHRMN